jgi:hypothetical protein
MDLDQVPPQIELDQPLITARLELVPGGQVADGAEYSAYWTLTWWSTWTVTSRHSGTS